MKFLYRHGWVALWGAIFLVQSAFAQQKQGAKDSVFQYEFKINTLSSLYEQSDVFVSTFYPNPVSIAESEYVEVECVIPATSSNVKIIVTNILGNVIGEYSLPSSHHIVRIPIVYFPIGIYFYTLSIGNQRLSTKKLVIKP